MIVVADISEENATTRIPAESEDFIWCDLFVILLTACNK
jgi:hypothetical protein